MLAEFCKKFIKSCNKEGVDILDQINNENCTVFNVVYNGITFFFEFYIYNDKLFGNGGLVGLILKGVEYYHDSFSLMTMEEYKDGEIDESSIEDIMYFITNCEVKKKMIKIAHSIDDLFNDFDDNEREFAIEYTKMNYED